MGEAGREGQRKENRRKDPCKANCYSAQPQTESRATGFEETLQKDSVWRNPPQAMQFFLSAGTKLPTPYLKWEKW